MEVANQRSNADEMLSASLTSNTISEDISLRNSIDNSNNPLKKQALKILADGKVMKVQKLRQRRILSCVHCHSKKIKCSRIHPICNNCEKLGIDCKYFSNERVSRGGKKSLRLNLEDQVDLVNENYTLSNFNASSRSNSITTKLSTDSSHDYNIKSEFSSNSDSLDVELTSPSNDTLKDANGNIPSNDFPKIKDNTNFRLKDHDQLMKEHVELIPKANSPSLPDMSLNYLNLNLFNQQNQQSNDSDDGLNDGTTRDKKSNNKLTYSTPPNISNSLLQTPIMNNLSNNITNIYFGTNYSNQPQQQQNSQNLQQTLQQNQMVNSNDDQFAFNLSSFAFTNNEGLSNINFSALNSPSNLQNPVPVNPNNSNKGSNDNNDNNDSKNNNSRTNSNAGSYYNRNTNNFFDSVPPQTTNTSNTTSNNNNPNATNANFNYATLNNNLGNQMLNFNTVQTPSLDSSSPTRVMNQSYKNEPNNPGLHNSLNAYSSNPATTMNYLYGTNTHYRNDTLLEELYQYLPSSPERSFELIDRYLNSVHILLPILINVNDFLKQHEKYWELLTLRQRNSAGEIKNSNSGKSNNTNSPDTSSPSSLSSTSSAANSEFDYLQFYSLYFPVLYASTISEFEEYDNLLLNQDINKYLKAFNKVCQYYNYPHGIKTITLLLGNVIIQSTSPNPSTMEMSQIIRYAKFLQMHKDPVKTLRINDFEVVKFRRLLWWVIFGLDALTSHNFCLPPVCRVEDFNVLMPEEEEPIFNELGLIKEKKLNVSILSMNVKFKFDKILSELVYHLHNGLSANITHDQINEIKRMIIALFEEVHRSIKKMNEFYKSNPPTTVAEMNLINFITNHSWSFVDRALMLLHKKILMGNPSKIEYGDTDPYSNKKDKDLTSKGKSGVLSLAKYEDTFGYLQEANIIKNFNNSSISQLKFNQFENFSYENMHNNLIPSILHNLNDFLKYNDFLKFGKYNWYVKRTIPLDSIILMFVIITVKFKYEFMTLSELCIYVKLINKALFILNRKWFKNEKYKRMLSLTNLTWEYILKRYNIITLINQYNESNKISNGNGRVEFFDYQVTSYMNLNELFNIMDVPQPRITSDDLEESIPNYGNQTDQSHNSKYFSMKELQNKDTIDFFSNSLGKNNPNEEIIPVMNNVHKLARSINLTMDTRAELSQLNEKIYYDLRNNFVDINDYCAFYTSLEHILHELMDYIHKP